MTANEPMAQPRRSEAVRRRRRLLPYVLLLVLSLGLSGCGVGATARPVDEGDFAEGGGVGPAGAPPGPDQATSAEGQVRNFLQAAAGGYTQAVERMQSYLTPDGLSRWPGPTAEIPNVTVVRLKGPPTSGASIGGRTLVTVTYETIGSLNESGRIEDLAGSAPKELRFWVVANPARELSLRIDEIEGWPPGALLLSDEGLQNQYQMQPIYFWDMEYELLVPDLRYMSTTLNEELRAKQVLKWLVGGPSSWVNGVQALPVGTSEPLVVISDQTIVVDLSAAVIGTGGPEAVQKLIYQLQWSFAALKGGDTARAIELRIEGAAPVHVDDDMFRRYNHSFSYDDREPVRYDVGSQGVVVASGGAVSGPLASPENAGVRKAAVSLDQTMAAFVRADNSGIRSLKIVGPRGVVSAEVPATSTLGRPIFVPKTNVVLVPTGDGRLFAVSTKDGSATEASHTLPDVTSVAVSPDGRRLAFVSDGEVFVSSLVVVDDDEVTVASQGRRVLANRLEARTVTWTAESWLLVAGASETGQALWRSSADGVLVEDLSGSLDGLHVQELVSYPRWTGSPRWSSRIGNDVLAVASPGGVYSFRTRTSPETGVIDPFFGS